MLDPLLEHGEIEIKNIDPFDDSFFGTGNNPIEENTETKITPMCPAFIDITTIIYQQLKMNDVTLQKNILPGYLNYYSGALIWMRLVSLKKKLSYPLTQLETELMAVIEGKSFSISTPLLKQLQLFDRSIDTICSIVHILSYMYVH